MKALAARCGTNYTSSRQLIGDQLAIPFHRWRCPDGTLWAEFFHGEADAVIIRFANLAEFEISADGQSVRSAPAEGVDGHTLEHLYLNQVLPLALGRRGKFVFHGSAVDLGGFAAAFVAASGRGKSTIVASFARDGHPFLTDDALILELYRGSFAVTPSHPSIRLWSDSEQQLGGSASRAPEVSYTSKVRLLAGGEFNFASGLCPLRAIYCLGSGESDGVTIAQLGPADSVMSLARHSFIADVENPTRLTQLLDQMALVASAVPFFHLDYPRDYGRLPCVKNAIKAHAESLGSSE